MDGGHRVEDHLAPGDGIWARGGAWVVAQFPLTALALFAARVGPTEIEARLHHELESEAVGGNRLAALLGRAVLQHG